MYAFIYVPHLCDLSSSDKFFLLYHIFLNNVLWYNYSWISYSFAECKPKTSKIVLNFYIDGCSNMSNFYSTNMSTSSSSPTFTSQIAEEKRFKIAQEFQPIEEAITTYNAYIQEWEFSARMSTSKKEKGTNELIWKLFIFSKQRQTYDTYEKKLKDYIP